MSCGWATALIVGICLPLILLALVCAMKGGRRNPVIRANPQPDHRVYSTRKEPR